MQVSKRATRIDLHESAKRPQRGFDFAARKQPVASDAFGSIRDIRQRIGRPPAVSGQLRSLTVTICLQ